MESAAVGQDTSRLGVVFHPHFEQELALVSSHEQGASRGPGEASSFATLGVSTVSARLFGSTFASSSARASAWGPNSRRSRCARRSVATAAPLGDASWSPEQWRDLVEDTDAERTASAAIRPARLANAAAVVVLAVVMMVLETSCVGIEAPENYASPAVVVAIGVAGVTAAMTQVLAHDGHSGRVALFALVNFITPWSTALSHVMFSTQYYVLGLLTHAVIMYPAYFTTIVLLMWLTGDSVAQVSCALNVRTAKLFGRLSRLCYGLAVLNVLEFPLIVWLQDELWFNRLRGIVTWFVIVAFLMWFLTALVVLRTGADLAREAARQGSARQADECNLAARTIRRSICGFSLAAILYTIHSVIFALKIGAMWPLPQYDFGEHWTTVIGLAGCCNYTGSALCAVYLSGACSGSLCAGRRRLAKEQARQRLWTEATQRQRLCTEALQRPSVASDELWSNKVRELSLRGFSLRALLDFYRGLGAMYMEHFTPKRHRTVDVVRGAIIPTSASAGSALACVMMQNEPTRPQKMVTHNWGNLFRDLVAAIIADALEEEEFDRISELLEQREIDRLESWCRAAGKLDTSYWVCAFSVNQHCTICGQNPDGGCDSVTMELYPLCACGVPKVSNVSQPTNDRGESIQCEVNKFDDMMKLLSAGDRGFEQVVAIDFAFDLFTRAWCVAELAAASEMGMQQKLKFSSEERLNAKEDELRKLKIQDMKASRPEDKARILGKIENVDAFNAKLQRLLFEDLLPSWGDLDAVEQIHRLARIARWQHLERERTLRAATSQTASLASSLAAAFSTSRSC